MELSKDVAEEIEELGIGTTVDSFRSFLDSQREIFHGQIDDLQSVVAIQCKLTGVNPLSHEMAAGALSIKIGKRSTELLNPKAVKYMQSVFSIKDNITKKEAREIAALCGITVTQVKDFFSGHRSKVRKLVKASRDEAGRLNLSSSTPDGQPTSLEPNVSDTARVSETSSDLAIVETVPLCSVQDEMIPGLDPSEKNLIENTFSLMKKEDTFSGQAKLLDWILQVQNSAVLLWFLAKGGITILGNWLSVAASEEQTTLLVVILKVLCHLPLHKALPLQMSSILQIVNRLRFYRTSDISNRAKILLARWSKLFLRSQASKRPASGSTDLQKEIFRMQRINELLNNDCRTKISATDDILGLTPDTAGKSESPQSLKLLTDSAYDSTKKLSRGISSKTREKRKVLLVEQPVRSNTGRNSQVARVVHARPMSTDDIQKAKMRASFLQSKNNKDGVPNRSAGPINKVGDRVMVPFSKDSILLSQRKKLMEKQVEVLQPVEKNDVKTNIETSGALMVSASIHDKTVESPQTTARDLSGLQKPQSPKIPWRKPPEIRINCLWRIGAGEKSKEVEVQTQRLKRERETLYRRTQDIPPNPKEPWDMEMDFDDSLTPEIPIEQLPSNDESPSDTTHPTSVDVTSSATTAESSAAANAVAAASNVTAGPDLELLAVLLKNPELVFALTSGQGKNMSKEETNTLLDILKSGSISLAGVPNGSTASSSSQRMAQPEIHPGPLNAIPSVSSQNSLRPESVEKMQDVSSSMAFTQHLQALGTPAVTASLLPNPRTPAATVPTLHQQILSTGALLLHHQAAAAMPLTNESDGDQINRALRLPANGMPVHIPEAAMSIKWTHPAIFPSQHVPPISSSATSHISGDRRNHDLRVPSSSSSSLGKEMSNRQPLPPLLPTPTRQQSPALISEPPISPQIRGWRPETPNDSVSVMAQYNSGGRLVSPIETVSSLGNKAGRVPGPIWEQNVSESRRSRYDELLPVQPQTIWSEPNRFRSESGEEGDGFRGDSAFEMWSPERNPSPPVAPNYIPHGRRTWNRSGSGSTLDRPNGWGHRDRDRSVRPWNNRRHGNKRDRDRRR